MYEYGVSLDMALDFKKEIKTRSGDEVKIYCAYPYAFHGAWYNDSTKAWVAATWSVPNGYHTHRSYLDLVNV